MIKLALVLGALLAVSGMGTVASAEDAISCQDCHTDHVGRKFAHYPAESGLCTACHEPGANHLDGSDPKAMKTDRTSAACYQCHESKESRKSVHAALQMDGQCVNCHDPHGSDRGFFMKQEPAKLCVSCHTPAPANSKSVHGALKSERSCLACHTPHSSNESHLLVKTGPELCLSCHDRKMTVLDPADGSVDHIMPDIKHKIREMPFVHEPAKDSCTTCHSPHSSPFDKLFVAPFPDAVHLKYVEGNDKTPNTYALCFQCHDSAMLKRNGETKFRSDKKKGSSIVRKNLHWFHVVDAAGNPNKAMGRSCITCHDPHGTSQPHNVKNAWAMGPAFDLRIQYQATPTGGECTRSCHSPKSYQRLD